MIKPRPLGQRALNRALLGRQHLIRRTSMPVATMVERLVGMQAQAPLSAYVGLWDRLDPFDPAELAGLLTDRKVVRTHVMRSTIHLLTARDALAIRPLIRPVASTALNGQFGRRLTGVDLEAVVAAGRELMTERPRTRGELRDLLGERWPHWDAEAMAFAAGYLTSSVQVPPRGVWGSNGPAAYGDLETWLGAPLDPEPSVDDVVLRYLRAFGPASVRDIQLWSGLTRLREVVSRHDLTVHVDAGGNELYDVPDGLLPDPDTPVPVRYLPEYDNVLLSHADRSRVIPERRPVPLPPGNGATTGTVLVDGMYQADWKLTRDRTAIEVGPYRDLSPAERDDVIAEGLRLLEFLSPGTPVPEVRIRPTRR